jgi:hypothetical protein
MSTKQLSLVVALAALFLSIRVVEAKVTPEEAGKLGKELTPMGAIQAGNDAGTIPPWEGGIKEPPPSYKLGMHHPDPFPDDEILFTITPQNLQMHKDKLSPGQIAMFKRYPKTWRMNVYPTRRSASFPQRIYDATIANATTAELSLGGNGVINAKESAPFPIPKEGVEPIWNHVLRYRGEHLHQIYSQATPTAIGTYTIVKIDNKVLFPYALPGATIESINNRALYFLQVVTEPARLAGTLLLVYETLDQVKEPRKAWTYNPGQRRVRRAPNVAYDVPGMASDGQRTNDGFDMFNGAPDRYSWELMGRREMYVGYNSYKLHSDKVKYDEIIKPGHLNPDLLRYELHRVWVFEGKVREGTNHLYPRRTFYADEDSWQIMAVDQYDARQLLWRVSEAYVINYYEKQLVFDTVNVAYDLQNGRYIVSGLNNQDPIEDFNADLNLDDFTPNALRRGGRR